jgi:hypothetical protein
LRWISPIATSALPLGGAGYLLQMTPANHEKFEWLASSVRRYGGQASVIQAHAIDDLPHEDLVRRFAETRAKDDAAIARDVKKLGKHPAAPKLTKFRKTFSEGGGRRLLRQPDARPDRSAAGASGAAGRQRGGADPQEERIPAPHLGHAPAPWDRSRVVGLADHAFHRS